MNENIHKFIKKEYEARQKNNHEKLLSRKAKAYSCVPGLEDIDDQIRISGIKYSKMILAGSDPADLVISKLYTEIENLKAKRQLLLEKFQYPEDYLDMTYQCELCKDTGFIESPTGMERCSCYKQFMINQVFKQSNLNLIETENFGLFNEEYYIDNVDEVKYGITVSPRENIRLIKERCLKFIENFSLSEEKNLFFSGPTGVGKTFMCSCIAYELLNKGITVLYQTAPMLFNTINEYKINSFKNDGFEDSRYKEIFESELLIIDDLGTEPQSAARYAELLTILNTRHINNLAKPCKTIISTNIGPKKLYEYYTERVTSRIMGCFDRLMFVGDDIRAIKG